jgi:hypothetical protein
LHILVYKLFFSAFTFLFHSSHATTDFENLKLSGKIEKNKMVGTYGTYGEGRGVHRVLVGKPEGKRPLERPRRRWGDKIKIDIQEVGEGYGD